MSGNHVDDDFDPGRIGCRAVDRVEEHLDHISPRTLFEIEAFLHEMLGAEFSSEASDRILASTVRLLALEDQYFSSKAEALDHIVASSPQGVPVLSGEHKEVILNINLVKNETFHRDHFSSRFGGRM